VRDRHLISVDELRAAGALDVPPAWRKSLGGSDHRFSRRCPRPATTRTERHLFSGLSDDVPDDTGHVPDDTGPLDEQDPPSEA
jgi:hypothetical protein